MTRVLSKLLTGAFFALVLGLAALMLLPAALGYKRYVITTGSMTGTMDPGTLAFDKAVPVGDLKVGDVITYMPPSGNDIDALVTHRIHSIGRGADGKVAIRTKGDANDAPDSWTFTPTRPTLNKVEAHLPHVGHAYARLNTKTGRTLVFAIPGLIIAFSVLAGLWKEAGEDMRRRQREGGVSQEVVA